MEGVNPTKIYFRHISKYHSVSPGQILYANKIRKNKIQKKRESNEMKKLKGTIESQAQFSCSIDVCASQG
jgi:hypothetical protein